MQKKSREKRKYLRFDTEAKIYFRVAYDIKTKVKFRVVKKEGRGALSERYQGLSKNINIEGLRFSSEKRLKIGERLYIELYLPKLKKPVCMTGDVRWSRMVSSRMKGRYKFDTGVRLISVFGKLVSDSIYFDKKNQILWSIVLDSIFGNFRKLMRHK